MDRREFIAKTFAAGFVAGVPMNTLLDRLAMRLAPTVWEIPGGRAPALPHFEPGPDFDPGGAHDLLLYAGSRGSGKTEHASRRFGRLMRENIWRGRIIGPTLGDVIESCINGPSGLRAMDPEIEFNASAPGGAQVKWPNGSVAVCLGTHQPSDIERFRATGNRHIDWWEELASCGHNGVLLQDAWDQAKFGLRLGATPHSMASTTPKSHPTYLKLHKADTTYKMVGTVFQNPHLPVSFKDMLVKRYEGTRIGRQELYGELLEDAEGALWLTVTISEIMHADLGDLNDDGGGRGLTVMAIDPSIGAGEPDSDECGIVVGCLGQDDPSTAWILDDASLRADPGGWARKCRDVFHDWSVDYAVAESNQGGGMVRETLGRYAPEIPLRTVWAKRGKALRADPVAVLSEQGKVRLIVRSSKLEEQMCLVAGTLILTNRGHVPIEEVTTDDLVLTREGWAPLQWSGQTTTVERTAVVQHEHGEVESTTWHPFWSESSARFVGAKTVNRSDRLLAEPQWASTARLSLGEAAGGRRPEMATTGTRKPEDCSIESRGKSITDRFPMAGSSTMSTSARETLGSRISNASRGPSTPFAIRTEAESGRNPQRSVPNAGSESGPNASRSSGRASFAGAPSIRRASGLRTAGVRAVGERLYDEPVPVFDLKVADGFLPEFFANGVLVHNTTWEPLSGNASPDRLDAMVYCVLSLLPRGNQAQDLFVDTSTRFRRR